MTAETDAEFVERISRAIYDSNSTHKDADLIRLFALARRGAEAAARIERLEAALLKIKRGAVWNADIEAFISAALEERT